MTVKVYKDATITAVTAQLRDDGVSEWVNYYTKLVPEL